MATDRCYADQEMAPGYPDRSASPGGVSEWSKETVLKTVGPDPGLVGSNPTPSASEAQPCEPRTWYLVSWYVVGGFAADLERWPSGRRRSPAKRVGGVKPPRGFTSLSAVEPIEWTANRMNCHTGVCALNQWQWWRWAFLDLALAVIATMAALTLYNEVLG